MKDARMFDKKIFCSAIRWIGMFVTNLWEADV